MNSCSTCANRPVMWMPNYDNSLQAEYQTLTLDGFKQVNGEGLNGCREKSVKGRRWGERVRVFKALCTIRPLCFYTEKSDETGRQTIFISHGHALSAASCVCHCVPLWQKTFTTAPKSMWQTNMGTLLDQSNNRISLSDVPATPLYSTFVLV